MTEDERKVLMDMGEKIETVHDYLFKKPVGKDETRAARIERLLNGVDAGKVGFRMVLWFAGFITAMGAAWGTLKGWWPTK